MKTFVMKCRVRSITEEESGLNTTPSVRWRIGLGPEIPEDEYRHRTTPLLLPGGQGASLVVHVAERPELGAGDVVEIEVRKGEART